jgi:uncharacterized protein YbaR (Trm112 family)
MLERGLVSLGRKLSGGPFLDGYNALKEVVKRVKEFSDVFVLGDDIWSGLGTVRVIDDFDTLKRFFVLTPAYTRMLGVYEGYMYVSANLAAFIRTAKKTDLYVYPAGLNRLVFENDKQDLLYTADICPGNREVKDPLREILRLNLEEDLWENMYCGDMTDWISVTDQIPVILNKEVGVVTVPHTIYFTKEQFPSANKESRLYVYNKIFPPKDVDFQDSIGQILMKLSDDVLDVYTVLTFLKLA